MTNGRRYASIWDALEETPEEAAALRVKSELLIALHEAVRSWDTAPARAASRLDLTEARLADLLAGDLDSFTLDALVALASRGGLAIRLDVAPAA